MKPLSFTLGAVLLAIAGGARHGFDIMGAAGLPSGTVYPALARLEERGYVRSRWETPASAQKARRPARRYYALTTAGRDALAVTVRHYQTLGNRVPLDRRLACKPE
jgi:DNA-binding PadR family transcriptional regulator